MKKTWIVLAALATATATAALVQNVTLVQWFQPYGEEGVPEAIQRNARAYEKAHPNVKIQATMLAGEYTSKLNPALAAGTGPDIFEVGAENAYVYMKAGQLAPLDDLFTPQVRKEFDPSVLAGNTYKGRIYAVRTLIDPMMIFYRKSALAKAGVKPPTTFAELLTAVNKLNTGGQKGLFMGNDGGVALGTWLLAYSTGSNLVQNGKFTVNTPRIAKAYEGLRALNKSGALLIGSPTDWWDYSPLAQGLTAMQVTGIWNVPSLQEALGDDLGVMPWPKFDAQGRPVAYVSGWNIAVNAKSKNLAAAKALVKAQWIDNTPLQVEWNTGFGFHLPARKSAVAAAAKLKTGAGAQAANIGRTYGRSSPSVWSADVQQPLNDAVTAIIKSDQSAATILAQAQRKSQAALDRLSK